jgi:threonine aldolase
MQFGSDNQTGASRQVLDMMEKANSGHTHGYGNDDWTKAAADALRELFACDLEAFFLATGTAANVLALSCMVQPWQAVLCHHQAHILLDESTAPEFFTGGSRLVPISRGDGKITAGHLEHYFMCAGKDVPHNAMAGALSITDSSEMGLVYTPDEVAGLSRAAHERGLRIHMDGARFANAVASLGCAPAELTWKAGIDVLCLGATKCGALAAEAVIFFNRELAETFIHRRKRSGHLLSKGRFLASQFLGWLRNGHWLELAAHANRSASQLSVELSSIPGVSVVWPVQANELFVVMPKRIVSILQEAGAEFYEWYPGALPPGFELGGEEACIRLVTSFITEEDQIWQFVNLVRESAG